MKKSKKKIAECHDCTEVHAIIAEYMGGEADDELTRELLLHSQSCPDCARLLRTLKRLVHSLHLEPHCEMPVAVRKELWLTIRKELYAE